MAAPKGNLNAEKWTLEEATALMERALVVCKEKGFDFIGEVACELDTYRDIFVYLKDKFDECKPLYKRLEQQCEANCFSHGKTGDIVPSLAIMNLKSNHGWTDRVATDHTTGGEKMDIAPITWVKTNDPTE
jgi:hypothetical protein